MAGFLCKLFVSELREYVTMCGEPFTVCRHQVVNGVPILELIHWLSLNGTTFNKD